MRIRLRPETAGGRILLAAASGALQRAVPALGRTWRLTVDDPAGTLESLARGGGPVILCHWHNRSILAAFVYHGIQSRGGNLTLVASRSRDGEIVARVAGAWGAGVVRGSSARGGASALLGAIRAVRRGGSSPVVAPDGPRGPRYHAKAGVVALARAAGVPIVPLGLAARRFRRLRSWDRLVVPAPFTTVSVVVGELLAVEGEADAAALLEARERLQASMEAVTRAAEVAVGLEGPEGPGREDP